VQILRRDLPEEESEGFASVVRAKSHAAQTVLTMQARTNEMLLKKQALDKLPDLLRLIRDEEQRGTLIEHYTP
jgi:hypothetical protein